MIMKVPFFLIFLVLSFLSCQSQTDNTSKIFVEEFEQNQHIPFDSTFKTIHIFVALCDNKYQGIVPVPAKIGNGQDPNNNLYWGCGYGIRTYFKRSQEWKLIRTQKLDSIRLERLIFKHVSKKFFLVADVYDGQYIEKCTKDFLKCSAGLLKDTIQLNQTTIGIGGNSSLVSYIGHNGLMDFQLDETYKNTDSKKRDVIILACYSKSYFSGPLGNSNVNPLAWSTHLMSPEAYSIHDAISGYVLNESNEKIRTRAALAYNKFQKCGERAARNLLVTGW